MKTMVFILGFIIANLSVSAQIWSSFDEYFSSKDCAELKRGYADYGYRFSESQEISYYIDFFKKEKAFEINCTIQLTHDILDGFCVSSGFFKRNGDHLYLHDTSTDLKMKVVIKGGKLTFVEGYKLLEDKVFRQIFNSGTEGMYIPRKYSFVEMVIIGLLKSNWPDVVPGYYKGRWVVLGLHLNDDGTFIYGSDDDSLVVLQGTWSQNGNLLILHDTHTDHDFYLVGEKTGWRPMYLPGYWGLVLRSDDSQGRLLKLRQPD